MLVSQSLGQPLSRKGISKLVDGALKDPTSSTTSFADNYRYTAALKSRLGAILATL